MEPKIALAGFLFSTWDHMPLLERLLGAAFLGLAFEAVSLFSLVLAAWFVAKLLEGDQSGDVEELVQKVTGDLDVWVPALVLTAFVYVWLQTSKSTRSISWLNAW